MTKSGSALRQPGRRHTPARLKYLSEANRAKIGTVNRGQLSILAQALPCLGIINATEAHLLSVLINTAASTAFDAGGKPVVFKSNIQLGFEIGRSPGRVSRLLSRLFDVGLITMQDSGNYKRYPIRDGDMVVDACGIDLRILIHRYDELWSAVQLARQEQHARLSAQRRYRGAVRNLIATLQSWPTQATRIMTVKARLERIQAAVRSSAELTADYLKRAHTLIHRLSMLLQDETNKQIYENMTCPDVKNDIHKQITTPHQTRISNDERRSAYADQHNPKAGCASKLAYEKSLVAPDVPVKQTVAAQVPLAALDDLLDAVRPALTEWGLPAPRSWTDLSQLTPQMCRIAGISEDARTQAVSAMGNQAAAAAIAITLAKHSARLVNSPGGYLRAMTIRAGSGALNLRASIFGLASQNRAV